MQVCDEADAIIYYTTDGTIPTDESDVYSETFEVYRCHCFSNIFYEKKTQSTSVLCYFV